MTKDTMERIQNEIRDATLYDYIWASDFSKEDYKELLLSCISLIDCYEDFTSNRDMMSHILDCYYFKGE